MAAVLDLVLRKLLVRLQVASLLLVGLALAGCSPESPSLGGASPGGGAAQGAIAPLSDAEFDRLPIDDQYRVANKLMATLYSGLPVDEFYDLESGAPLTFKSWDGQSLSAIRRQLLTGLTQAQRMELDLEITGDENAADEAEREPRYRMDRSRPKQMPLARMFHYPMSRDAFSQWMAWQLGNSILFSPAEEIDSADITDVQNLFRRLDLGLMSGQSIRDMVASHQRSVQNWRRFRSPEDNTREMMEIYLGLFDNDEDVPKASQACQDLYLTDEANGYKLAYTDYPNGEPVLVLDQYVTNCNDFYDLIAGHPLLIPRVTSVIVDYFFAGRSVEDRSAITEAIVATNPHGFDDIYLAILFSKNYLFDTERPMAFEEAFLGLAKRLRWEAHPDVFRGMVSGSGSVARADMREMGWPALSLKLGRVSSVPLDSLSFGNYHKALRESLLLDESRWRDTLSLRAPTAPEPKPVEAPPDDATARELTVHAAEVREYEEAVAALDAATRAEYDEALAKYRIDHERYRRIDDLTMPQLFDFLFLSVVQRRSTAVERQDLHALMYSQGHLDEDFNNAFARSGRQDEIARIVFDYLSRLPEAYYLRAIRQNADDPA